jgi:hypothetical protein
MKDSYFYKSLFSTLLVYLVLMTTLIAFVVITGITGIFLIMLGVVLLLAYFYGGFKILLNIMK